MMKARLFTGCLAVTLWFSGIAAAQFSSGSTGADGALNYTVAGTYEFDPAVLNLNPAGDNIFHFTTINVGAGVTLTMKSSKLRGKPVIWLATGNVTIAGTLNLTGASGAQSGKFQQRRLDYPADSDRTGARGLPRWCWRAARRCRLSGLGTRRSANTNECVLQCWRQWVICGHWVRNPRRCDLREYPTGTSARRLRRIRRMRSTVECGG